MKMATKLLSLASATASAPLFAESASSSDHLIVQSDKLLAVGSELSFQINYSALTRAMTSPFVTKAMKPQRVMDSTYRPSLSIEM